MGITIHVFQIRISGAQLLRPFFWDSRFFQCRNNWRTCNKQTKKEWPTLHNWAFTDLFHKQRWDKPRSVYIYIYISLCVYSTYSWMYYVIYYVWHVLCESNSKKKVLHQIQQMDDDLPKHLTSNHFSSRTAPPCKWQQPPGPVMWCKHSWRHMPHRCGLGKDDMVLPSPIGLPTWKL